MIRWLPFLLLLPFLAACEDDDMVTPSPEPPSPTPFTYLALGDSYTIGTSVAAESRWPRQLLDSLIVAGTVQADAPARQLTYVAVNGWTTDDLTAGIAAATLEPRYELVSLLIGVNDEFQGRPVADYGPKFTGLLNTAVRLAGGRPEKVFVVSIPDYSFTPFGQSRPNVSERLAAYNAVAEDVCAARTIPFLNITPISRRGLDQPALVADDRLHPSGTQYARWVEEVLFSPVAELVAGE